MINDFTFKIYAAEAEIIELRERLKATRGEEPIRFLKILLEEAETKLRLLKSERDPSASPQP